MDCLNKYQLKNVLDRLYDGHKPNALWITRIRMFYVDKKDITREHKVYLFLIRNGLTGKRLDDFFNEQGNFLIAMNYICNKLDGRKFHKETIKADELF